MGKVIFKLETNENLAHLDIENAQDEHITGIINGVFQVFGTNVEDHSCTNHRQAAQAKKIASTILGDVKALQEQQPVVLPPAELSMEVVASEGEPSTKYYTKTARDQINSAFNVALDVPPEKDEEGEELKLVLDKYVDVPNMDDNTVPAHFKTGYKVRADEHGNNIKMFKTRYQCPKCGKKGTHYIPAGTDFVDCWECQTTMEVKKAVAGTTPTPDPFLNWYIAGDQKRVKVVTQEHYDKLSHQRH